jgi:hypothetical protein
LRLYLIRHGNKWLLSLFIALFIAISFLLDGFAHSDEKIKFYQDDRELVEVGLWHQDIGEKGLELLITDVVSGTESVLRDTRGVESIIEAFANKEFFVVVARSWGGKAHYIWIIHRATRTEIAKYLCFWPVVSPDQSGVVFEVFRPRFPPVGKTRTAGFMYVDLDNPEKGILVYPIEDDAENGSDYFYRRASPFTWSADSRQVVFLAGKGTNTVRSDGDSIEIVRVSFSETAVPVVSVENIDGTLHALIPEGAAENRAFFARIMEWQDNRHIITRGLRSKWWGTDNIVIDLHSPNK